MTPHAKVYFKHFGHPIPDDLIFEQFVERYSDM